MRVILDTNVLVSALINPQGITSQIVDEWLNDRFDLLTHEMQIDELRIVTRRPRFRPLFRTAVAGRLVNQLRDNAVILARLPQIRRSNDPNDDFLLAMCEAGEADYLVTGDKTGLLALKTHRRTTIVTARG